MTDRRGGGGAVDEGRREKLKREAGWLCSGNVMSTLTRELPNRHAHARLSPTSLPLPSSSSPPSTPTAVMHNPRRRLLHQPRYNVAG